MKNLLIEFLLYVTINFINEDWSETTKLGKIYYYPFWFVRSILIWLISPILLIPFFITRTETWKQFILTIDDMMKLEQEHKLQK